MRPPRPEKKALLLLSISILAFTSVFSFIFLSITVKAYTLDDLINWLTSLLQPGGGGIRGQIFQGVGECAGVTGPAPSTWRFTCWVNGEKGGTFDCWDQSNNWKGYRACSSNEICNGPATGNWPCSTSTSGGTYSYTVSVSGLNNAYTRLFRDNIDVGCLSTTGTNGCAASNQWTGLSGSHTASVQSSVTTTDGKTCTIQGGTSVSFSSEGSTTFSYSCPGTTGTTTLEVSPTSGTVNNYFTFTITFPQFPDSSTPARLEYQPQGGSWQIYGSQLKVSDFSRSGNSIYGESRPNDFGITQAGTYNFRAVYGTTNQVTNTRTITLTGTCPVGGDIAVANLDSNGNEKNSFAPGEAIAFRVRVTVTSSGSQSGTAAVHDEVWQDGNCDGDKDDVGDIYATGSREMPGGDPGINRVLSVGTNDLNLWSATSSTSQARRCFVHVLFWETKPLSSTNPCH